MLVIVKEHGENKPEFDKWIQDYDRLIFFAKNQEGESVLFKNIGREADVRNEPINITSKSGRKLKQISIFVDYKFERNLIIDFFNKLKDS